jgi:hypothetical protein
VWLILGGLAVVSAFVMWRYGARIQEGLLRLVSRLSSAGKHL